VKIYAGPVLGEVTIGEIDKSSEARAMLREDLRMLYVDGRMYRQVKHYKGAFCTGVSWEECDGAGRIRRELE